MSSVVGHPLLAQDSERQRQRTIQQALQARIDQVQALRERGMVRDTIIKAVWGVKRRNTAPYEAASREYDFIEGLLQK